MNIVLAEETWKGVEPGTEAVVERWQVREGERVVAGQVLALAMLIKASCEVKAPASGVVDRILVPAEQSFARGQTLATLREA